MSSSSISSKAIQVSTSEEGNVKMEIATTTVKAASFVAPSNEIEYPSCVTDSSVSNRVTPSLSAAQKNSGESVFVQPLLPPPLSSNQKASPSGPSLTAVSSSSSSIPSRTTKDKSEKHALEKEEKYRQILSTLNYQPPQYGAACADIRYNLEVLKNGTIVDSVKFSSFDRKGYYIVGRVPGCDIVAENPTVSRMHAILQFIQCPKEKSKSGDDVTDSPQETGLYLFDLKSTHGTFLNKNQLFPQKYYRVHVGHVLKFGSSQRMYIVNGPDEDEEEESDKSVTELLNERLQKDLERKRLEEEEQLKRDKVASNSKLPSENIEVEGINWGMGEDADEESDMRINPFAMDYEASELTLDNPKKTLRSWFEREGNDLEFEMREKGNGQYICRIGLPLDGPTDGPVYAESEVKGKKKEAVHDAAMKACKILDSHGLLRASNQESRKRKEKKWEDEDYYSSDEDTFLDRTGSVEKKREKRMRLAGKSDGSSDSNIMTYDGLCTKYVELEKEITELQERIEKSQTVKDRADDGDVDIDDYMNLLKSGVFDVKKLKGRLREAQEEIARTKKLMEIAKPAELPAYLQINPVQTPESKIPPKVELAQSHIPTEESADEKLNPSSQAQSNEEITQPSMPKPTKPKNVMVGPMKPPPSSTPPKLYGLITASDLSILKSGPVRTPESSTARICGDDDALEEEDSSEEEGEGGVAADGELEDASLSSSSTAPEFEKPSKKKRQRYKYQQKNKQKTGDATTHSKFDDPDYSDWVPPSGQTGDGKTSLNAKFGY